MSDPVAITVRTPDDPIKIMLKAWRPGLTMRCRGCRKGHISADQPEPTCPTCGQKHVIMVKMVQQEQR